ncbi:MAG TPA: 3-mercaptopyruvate sulfurtransferase [Phenylobacterium sp.]
MTPGPLVSTAWLAERLGRPDLRIVDATWFMPGDGRSGIGEHRRAHIPGAVFFDIDAVADPAAALPHMLPTPGAFAEAAGRLGLSRQAATVVYDGQGIFSAPRVWWTLRAMGFPDVAVLDGGLQAWLAEGRPVAAGDAVPPPATVTPAFDAGLVRNLGDVQAVLASGAAQVLDARPAARFRGEAPEPRAGLRGGHMPGACNLPFASLIGEDGRMQGKAELAAAFAGAGIDLGKPVVTTCGSGVSAAVLALALAVLGHDRAAVYDGSWTEWGGRADTAVVTG